MTFQILEQNLQNDQILSTFHAIPEYPGDDFGWLIENHTAGFASSLAHFETHLTDSHKLCSL